MYSVVFESDKGESYVFGKEGNTVFDMDLGNGVSVNIGTSQGFSQIGETVQSTTVSGRTIPVKGVVYGNVQERKQTMRRIIAPFATGKLIFENQYYARVRVKDAPTFSSVRNDGRFTMQFYAPFPFFFEKNSKLYELGTIIPAFSFPVNYAESHTFGQRSSIRYKNIINDGDVNVPLNIYLQALGTVNNVVISNLDTFQNFKINGTINIGESVNIYRDNENVLRAELTSNGVVSDILSRIDESSDLFELNVGDNLIAVNDDNGGSNVLTRIEFSPAVVALYET